MADTSKNRKPCSPNYSWSPRHCITCTTISVLAAFCALYLISQRPDGFRLQPKVGAHKITTTLAGKIMQNSTSTLTARHTIESALSINNTEKKSKGNHSASNCTNEFRRQHFLTSVFDGRTGNRLFQLAALIVTAQIVCYTPVVHPKNLKHLETIFDIMNVKRVNFSIKLFRHLHEPAAGIYDANLTSRINPNYNWTLLGYRQSFKYFERYAPLIRSSLRIKEEIKRDVLQYLSSFPMYLLKVGLHVRRGDFLSLQRDGFAVSTMDYINRAIAYMKNRLGAAEKIFLVVSDDINWCKANMKGADIRFSSFNDVGRDLYLFTQCDHHVFTSGTFGWMGAWLNETGIVVYDKSYPTPNTVVGRVIKKDDYYPPRWIGL